MAEDFDPYYLWLGIPPQERPANHYRLLGVQLFEENPSVIESAADRQMAHLRSVQAGKHSALSQRLLNEVAAAKVCLLRAAQKTKYDQALRAKLDKQASQSAAAAAAKLAAAQPAPLPHAQPLAQAQPLAASAPAAANENFWEDITATTAKPAAKANKPAAQAHAAAPKKSPLKQLWPVFLVAGACLLVGVVVVVKNMNGQAEEPSPGGGIVQAAPPKPKESLLVFDWPAETRAGLTVTVDGAKVAAPASGPWEYRVPAGPHRVLASRAGFKPIERMVDAPLDGRRKITDAWQPLASLALDWPLDKRDGAVLSLDGQILTVGNDQPFTLPVAPGNHSVRITRAGFAPFEKDVTVDADQHQTLAIALQPTPATLVLRWPAGERAGAELKVDGEVHPTNGGSKENVELTLNPGTHSLHFKRSGFQSMTTSVTLDPAGHKTITPKWKPTEAPVSSQASNGQSPDSKNPGGDSPPAAKHPVPSSPDQQKVAKELDGIYKPLHDPAKDLAQAKELCNLALKAEDLTERYMLLLKGADFAVEAGDFSLALQAVDTLDAEFVVTPLEIKTKLLEKLIKIPAAGDQIADAVSNAERLIEDAIAADRYDLAISIVTSAGKLLLKKTVDPDFRRDTEKTLGAYRAQIKAIQPQWDLAQKAKQTLATSPNDADANYALGRWYCFSKGNWKTGLPYLVKSGNEKLKPVAQAELKSPSDANQKIAVADQWWDVAQKEAGPVADAIHLHAGDLYRSALPDLNSVLKKAAVDKRLAEVAEIRSRVGDSMPGQHSGPLVFQRGRWFDILKLVDVSRDGTGGNWTRNGSEVVCSGFGRGAPRLNLPVVLDGAYDLEIDFTRTSGQSYLRPVFFIGRRPCGLIFNSSGYSGLEAANGRLLDNFYRSTYSQGARFQVGQKYQSLISIRLGKGGMASVDIGVDGNRFLPHWEGDPSMLGVAEDSMDAKQLAIEVGYGGTVTFNAVRLKIVSGQGHFESLAGKQSSDNGNDGMPNKPANLTPKTKLAPGKS